MKFEEALKLMKEGKKVWVDKGRGEPSNYFYIERTKCLPDRIMCFDLLMQHANKAFLCGDEVLNCHWEEYHGPFLDKTEKEYLENVIRPFRKHVIYISLISSVNPGLAFIHIVLESQNMAVDLPYFKIGTMYKRMVFDKEYTLKELGLFEEDK